MASAKFNICLLHESIRYQNHRAKPGKQNMQQNKSRCINMQINAQHARIAIISVRTLSLNGQHLRDQDWQDWLAYSHLHASGACLTRFECECERYLSISSSLIVFELETEGTYPTDTSASHRMSAMHETTAAWGTRLVNAYRPGAINKAVEVYSPLRALCLEVGDNISQQHIYSFVTTWDTRIRLMRKLLERANSRANVICRVRCSPRAALGLKYLFLVQGNHGRADGMSLASHSPWQTSSVTLSHTDKSKGLSVAVCTLIYSHENVMCFSWVDICCM